MARSARTAAGRPPHPTRPSTSYASFGDANGDGTIDNDDYLLFRQTFTLSAGSSVFNAAFDYNGDGMVTNYDDAFFRQRLGETISPA